MAESKPLFQFDASKFMQKPIQDNKDTSSEVKDTAESEVVDYGDSTASFTPLVQLSEVHVLTGEENEIEMFRERTKLYRFFPKTPEWKERGIGEFKILSNKQTSKCRILMRQEKTLKVILNHFVIPNIVLTPNQSSDRSFIYSTIDFSEEADDRTSDTFAVRFKSKETAEAFKSEFEKAKEINLKLWNIHNKEKEKDQSGSVKKDKESEPKKDKESEPKKDKESEPIKDEVQKIGDKIEKTKL